MRWGHSLNSRLPVGSVRHQSDSTGSNATPTSWENPRMDVRRRRPRHRMPRIVLLRACVRILFGRMIDPQLNSCEWRFRSADRTLESEVNRRSRIPVRLSRWIGSTKSIPVGVAKRMNHEASQRHSCTLIHAFSFRAKRSDSDQRDGIFGSVRMMHFGNKKSRTTRIVRLLRNPIVRKINTCRDRRRVRPYRLPSAFPRSARRWSTAAWRRLQRFQGRCGSPSSDR